MWHTLQEAIQLTGRSRRTLYRDMGAGRVSYRVRDDGRRELETSELMRAYGALQEVAQPGTASVAQAGTPDGTPLTDDSPELLAALLDELRRLRAEVAGLREEMAGLRLLEYRPEPAAAVPEPEPEPEPLQAAAPAQQRKALSFADLLEGL